MLSDFVDEGKLFSSVGIAVEETSVGALAGRTRDVTSVELVLVGAVEELRTADAGTILGEFSGSRDPGPDLIVTDDAGPASDDVVDTKFPAMVDVVKTGTVISVAWTRPVGAPIPSEFHEQERSKEY